MRDDWYEAGLSEKWQSAILKRVEEEKHIEARIGKLRADLLALSRNLWHKRIESCG